MLKCTQNKGTNYAREWERDLGELPMTIKLKPGLELAFTALCHLAAEHYARGNQVLSAKQMRTRVCDVLATACEIGIADGTVDYNLPQTPSGERFDHKVNK